MAMTKAQCNPNAYYGNDLKPFKVNQKTPPIHFKTIKISWMYINQRILYSCSNKNKLHLE